MYLVIRITQELEIRVFFSFTVYSKVYENFNLTKHRKKMHFFTFKI
jgi:hypothetical protein